MTLAAIAIRLFAHFAFEMIGLRGLCFVAAGKCRTEIERGQAQRMRDHLSSMIHRFI